MLLANLEHALQAAAWNSVEADVIEVIAAVIDVPAATVEHILYAVDVLRNHPTGAALQALNEASAGPSLSVDLRQAIQTAVLAGFARTQVRRAIEHGLTMATTPAQLLPTPESLGQICRGCPVTLQCHAERLSEPAQCHTLGPLTQRGALVRTFRHTPHGKVEVHPLRIQANQVTVRCHHPAGVFTVDALALSPA